MKAEVPEFREVKEHLKVAVHIASVPLVHQPEVVLTFFLLFSKTQHHEHVRVHCAHLQPTGILPFILAYKLSDGFYMLCDD